MDSNFSCGSRIRALRIERGLSQEQLALAAGITPAYLGLVEREKKNPTVSIIERICRAMNISLAAFFSEAEASPAGTDEAEQQILCQLAILSSEEKRLVSTTIRNILLLRSMGIQNSKK